jgi:catechol 2,3-dioxygenase-like lactoylglutathione lyase family enzyme
MANPPSEFSGLNHVAIKVHNIRAAVKFYVEILGFKITRVVEPGVMHGATKNFGGCFIRCKNLHHDVLLMFTPEGIPNQPAPSALVADRGMHHFSLRVGSKQEFDAWADYCRAEEIEMFWEPAVHSAAHPEGDGFFGEHRGFFISDPSGNHIQILCDMAEIDPATNRVSEGWFRGRLERDGLDRNAVDPPPAWEPDYGFMED